MGARLNLTLHWVSLLLPHNKFINIHRKNLQKNQLLTLLPRLWCINALLKVTLTVQTTKMSCQCLMPKGTFHPMNLQDQYKPIKDMYLQGSINPNTTIVMTWIPLTPQVQSQPLSKLPVMTHTTPSVLIS